MTAANTDRQNSDNPIMEEKETAMSNMSRLYSDDPIVREQEAAKYRVFPKNVRIQRKWRKEWDDLLRGRNVDAGSAWPDSLLRLLRGRKWPEYTFGTANASCLVVLHRPGSKDGNPVKDDFISPDLPVLGGIPHAHNAFWYPKHNDSRTWKGLHRYLRPAFSRLENPWSQVMTTCLNPKHGRPGEVDHQANLRAVKEGGLLDSLVEFCQPRLVLLCGVPVREAVDRGNWNAPPNVEVLKCDHPSHQHWSRSGGEVKDAIERVLFP